MNKTRRHQTAKQQRADDRVGSRTGCGDFARVLLWPSCSALTLSILLALLLVPIGQSLAAERKIMVRVAQSQPTDVPPLEEEPPRVPPPEEKPPKVPPPEVPPPEEKPPEVPPPEEEPPRVPPPEVPPPEAQARQTPGAAFGCRNGLLEQQDRPNPPPHNLHPAEDPLE